MQIGEKIKQFYAFLKKDTWQSWIISLILIVILIKFIIFPILSLITGTSLPLVVVESCSMYHQSNFNNWWQDNNAKYEKFDLTKEKFEEFSLKNGLNKGDIVFVLGKDKYKDGDIIIFTSETQYPIIHRLMKTIPYQTQGDNNPSQLPIETNIQDTQIIGKATAKIPLIGWIKLIFFEPLKPKDKRGFCH